MMNFYTLSRSQNDLIRFLCKVVNKFKSIFFTTAFAKVCYHNYVLSCRTADFFLYG